MTGFSPAVRALIKDRAGVEGDYVRCEMCGQFQEYVQLHHRRARQRGRNLRTDTNLASNGVALCMADHAWVEDARLEAIARGLLLRQHHSPIDEPVQLWDGTWFLTDDGGRVACQEVA